MKRFSLLFLQKTVLASQNLSVDKITKGKKFKEQPRLMAEFDEWKKDQTGMFSDEANA